MKPQGLSFEASLLYQVPLSSSPALLVEEIRAIAQANDVTLEDIQETDRGFLLLICDSMQILIASLSVPLPADHFLQANRPRAATLNEAAILTRLTQMTGHVTILVADLEAGGPDDPAQFEKKRAMCWDLAECLLTRTHPSMVFWCENDTLYATEEFERACAYMASQDRDDQDFARSTRVPEMFLMDPILPEKARRWIVEQAAIIPCDAPTIAETLARPRALGRIGATALDTVASFTLPTRALVHLDRLELGWDNQRAMRGLTMACSTAAIGLCAQAGLPGLL